MESNNRQVELRHLPQTKQLLRLIGRIKFAELIELSERDFAKIVREIESDPLFRKLFSPSKPQEKVVSYLPFPRSGLSKNFCEFREDMAADRSSLDVESLLAKRKEIVPLIRRLGIDKFKKYFLYSNGEISYKDIVLACNLTEREVVKILAFIDDLAIQREFFSPSTINPGSNVAYSKIAQIEKDNSGDFVVSFFSPHLAKGRYLINYEKLAELRKKTVFTQAEMRKMDKLLKTLEIINTRKSIIYRIIRNVLKIQSRYLASRDAKELVPLTQKGLAKEMNVNPSLISRAIARRSIETPWGEEYPIEYFLPNRKKIVKRLITDIINDGKCIYTDEEIREELRKVFNIDISRRSVASYRKELKIPSYSGRIKSCKLKLVF